MKIVFWNLWAVVVCGFTAWMLVKIAGLLSHWVTESIYGKYTTFYGMIFPDCPLKSVITLIRLRTSSEKSLQWVMGLAKAHAEINKDDSLGFGGTCLDPMARLAAYTHAELQRREDKIKGQLCGKRRRKVEQEAIDLARIGRKRQGTEKT